MGVSIIAVGLVIYFMCIQDVIIFPVQDDYTFECYTDKANGGKSQVEDFSVSDSVIWLKFLLNDDITSPYVGISISPQENAYIPAAKYNQLNLEAEGLNIERIDISLYTPPPDDNSGIEEEMLYHSYLNISKQRRTYRILLSQFQHPDWWEDLHHIPESEENKPDRAHLLRINIGSAFSPDIDQVKTLKIFTIVLTRNNKVLFSYLGIIYLGILLSLLGIRFLVVYRRDRAAKITVAYQPLDITASKSDLEKCLEFINSNYSNSDLSLELISNETAVSPRRITNTIYKKYRCNFKTYLNRIRINESKRFLTQTNLTIGEIAYKVGFNTQSHFNRVFKSESAISPSEYRLSKK